MTDKPLRVLHVVASLGRGGAETMIMNHYRKIDRSLIQFDFLVNYPHRGEYEDEIEALGGRIYRTMPIRPWTYPLYFKMLDTFFAEHPGYIAVHSHIQDNSGFALKYAAKHGIACRIAHSHVANFSINYKYPFFLYARHYLHKYVNQRFACGNAAGRFMHGDAGYTVLRNAIDTPRFVFSPEVRAAKRAELGIGADTFVIGNVARFHPQKNHPFILRIFREIHRRDPHAVLLLCGSGDKLMDRMRGLTMELGIGESVRFLGSRDDVPQLLQAFDTILMPSIFEGLPVSIIEAQAAGLPCVLSDTIDPETAITDLAEFHPLQMSEAQWADIVLSKKGAPRHDMSRAIIDAGYDVSQNARWLTDFYLTHSPQTIHTAQ